SASPRPPPRRGVAELTIAQTLWSPLTSPAASGPLPTVAPFPRGELNAHLHHLMPPNPSPTARCGSREGLLTMPTALGHHSHHLVHLLDGQRRAGRAPGSRLAAALPASGRRCRPPRRLGRVRRWGAGGIRPGLARLGFQFPD